MKSIYTITSIILLCSFSMGCQTGSLVSKSRNNRARTRDTTVCERMLATAKVFESQGKYTQAEHVYKLVPKDSKHYQQAHTALLAMKEKQGPQKLALAKNSLPLKPTNEKLVAATPKLVPLTKPKEEPLLEISEQASNTPVANQPEFVELPEPPGKIILNHIASNSTSTLQNFKPVPLTLTKIPVENTKSVNTVEPATIPKQLTADVPFLKSTDEVTAEPKQTPQVLVSRNDILLQNKVLTESEEFLLPLISPEHCSTNEINKCELNDPAPLQTTEIPIIKPCPCDQNDTKELLLELTRGKNEETIYIELLKTCEDKQTLIPALKASMQQSSEINKLHAAWAYEEIVGHNTESHVVYTNGLNSTDESVTQYACYYLGESAPYSQAVADKLKKLLANGNDSIRIAAAEALLKGKMYSADAQLALVSCSELGSRDEKIQAISTLAYATDTVNKSTINNLFDLLGSPDEQVVVSTIYTLGFLHPYDDRVESVLTILMETDQTIYREAASLALECADYSASK